MNKKITRIAPLQAGKTMALVYFALGVVFAIFVGVLTSFTPAVPGQTKAPIVLFLAMPFAYGLAALIFVPLGCWLYNMAARITGGIEVREEASGEA